MTAWRGGVLLPRSSSGTWNIGSKRNNQQLWKPSMTAWLPLPSVLSEHGGPDAPSLPCLPTDVAAAASAQKSKVRQLPQRSKAQMIPTWCQLAASRRSSQTDLPQPVRTWTIKEIHARDIIERRKLFAAFPARPGARTLSVGDVVAFHWYRPCKIVGRIAEMHFFEDVPSMLRTLRCPELLPHEAADSTEESQRRCAALCQSLGRNFSGAIVAVRLADVQVCLSKALTQRPSHDLPERTHSRVAEPLGWLTCPNAVGPPTWDRILPNDVSMTLRAVWV